jgi:large subunit ribosomal protein L17
MRKRINKPVLGKGTKEKSDLINQIKTIFSYGKLETSLTNAKKLVRMVDMLLSQTKKGEPLQVQRQLERKVGNFKVAKQIYLYGTKETTKKSGYTRISKLGFRRGDGTAVAKVELIDYKEKVKTKKVKKTTKATDKTVKKDDTKKKTAVKEMVKKKNKK